MSISKKIVIGISSLIVLGVLAVAGLYYIWFVGIDDSSTGVKEGITRSAATDSPISLPAGATDIYYTYELYWQGGAMVVRYHLPHGDLKKQAEEHLQKVVTWKPITTTTASVPEHRFASYSWFQPTSITSGVESDTSGILWEPKVWIDDVNRRIYFLHQN